LPHRLGSQSMPLRPLAEQRCGQRTPAARAAMLVRDTTALIASEPPKHVSISTSFSRRIEASPGSGAIGSGSRGCQFSPDTMHGSRRPFRADGVDRRMPVRTNRTTAWGNYQVAMDGALAFSVTRGRQAPHRFRPTEARSRRSQAAIQHPGRPAPRTATSRRRRADTHGRRPQPDRRR
jgi:hypothetical protein